MNSLKNTITGNMIANEGNLAIFAKLDENGEFSPNSPAVVSEPCFNRNLANEGYVFFASSEFINREIARQLDGEDGDAVLMDEIAEFIIESINQN